LGRYNARYKKSVTTTKHPPEEIFSSVRFNRSSLHKMKQKSVHWARSTATITHPRATHLSSRRSPRDRVAVVAVKNSLPSLSGAAAAAADSSFRETLRYDDEADIIVAFVVVVAAADDVFFPNTAT
jgi:hypothetical protein